jgi:carbon storage regulator
MDMLVFSRKPNQQIVIGNQTVVTVLSVRGDRVKLGVASPLDVPIRRSEIAPHAAPTRKP